MLICGANGAGKTALLYYLATDEFRDTVSSIEDNLLKLDFGSVWDVPGHFHLRQRMIKGAEGSKVIVLVVDSKDWEKFSDAAKILFDVLNNTTISEK